VRRAKELPIYESRRTPAGLWQGYFVYREMIELRTIFGIFRLSYADIEEITVSPPIMTLLRQGKFKETGDLRSLKTDMADMKEHVVVKMRSGVMRSYRFTPENPQEFAYSANSALRHFPALARRQSNYEESELADSENARSR
jgi:hypothetical protein